MLKIRFFRKDVIRHKIKFWRSEKNLDICSVISKQSFYLKN